MLELSFQFLLRDALGHTIGSNNFLYCLQTDLCTQMHQSVVDILYIGGIRNIEGLLKNHTTGIDILVEEEGCDTRLFLTIDNGPIDGSSTTILGQ